MFRRSSGLSAGKYPVPGLDLNYAVTGALAGIETFTRASTAWAVNGAGMLTQHAANAPRFDHDPTTLQLRGLLFEEQRANMFLRSSEFSDATWAKTRVSVSPNSMVAPDGSLAAGKIVETATTGSHLIRQGLGTTTAGQTFATTVFAKAGERSVFTMLCSGASLNRSAHFDLSSGTVTGGAAGLTGSQSITRVGNGWYRCEAVFTIDASGTSGYVDYRLSNVANPAVTGASYAGDGASGLYLWGAQLEVGGFATSYIPTGSATVTRAMDVCTIPTSAFAFDASEGTLFAEVRNLGTINWSSARPVSFSDGTTSNLLEFYGDSPSSYAFNVSTGGANQANLSLAASSGAVNKLAGAYRLNDFAGAANGGAALSDILGTVPTINLLHIGNRAILARPYNGHIRRIAYFSRRLDNPTLGRITS